MGRAAGVGKGGRAADPIHAAVPRAPSSGRLVSAIGEEEAPSSPMLHPSPERFSRFPRDAADWLPRRNRDSTLLWYDRARLRCASVKNGCDGVNPTIEARVDACKALHHPVHDVWDRCSAPRYVRTLRSLRLSTRGRTATGSNEFSISEDELSPAAGAQIVGNPIRSS